MGRVKRGATFDLVARYLDRADAAGRRIGVSVDVVEIEESRARRSEDRRAEEARAVLGQVAGARFLALDEIGQSIDSAAFAALVGNVRDEGAGGLAIVIGGPDGLDPECRRGAAGVIAFGAMTWPHQLVRIMASEQIYRAVTILSGHPYHRA